MESGFLLSSSFKGGSIYLAKFTIFGYTVSAGGYEYLEGMGSAIEILQNPELIGATLGSLKEGAIHIVRISYDTCRESIDIIHYRYPCLGLYE